MKLLILVTVALPLAAASAATITVNTTADNTTAGDGKCTLREAIANVNAAADTTGGDCVAGFGTGDTISFSLTLPATIKLRRQLSIARDVTIMGPGSDVLAVDGRHATRVFHITAGSPSISGLTIRKGRIRSRHARGGGILVESGAILDLTNCTLSDNIANGTRLGSGAGGAIAIYGAATLTGCTLSGNTAKGGAGFLDPPRGGFGGAIVIFGRATITDCNFSSSSSATTGGGIANGGTATLTSCTLSGNTAAYTGGGIVNNGTITLTDCVLNGNIGEGLANTGTATLTNCTLTGNGVFNEGTATLMNCTVSGNTGAGISNALGSTSLTVANSTLSGNAGPGIYNYEATLAVTNSTLSANIGGGIVQLFGMATITNCTVSGNTAGNLWGGVGIDSAGGTSLLNSIVAGNQPHDCHSPSPPLTSNGHNLDSDGTCFSSGGTDLIDTDPQLGPLGNYGGATQTLALCTAPGVPDASCSGPSPAIDTGDDSVTGSPDNLTTDQRGLPRLSGAHVDIGAYEVQ